MPADIAVNPSEASPSVGRARRVRAWTTVALVVWAAAAAWYLAQLLVPAALGDLGCKDAAGSSVYGHATWSWTPPGTACAYPRVELGGSSAHHVARAHTEYPSAWSAVALLALVAWPAAVLAVRRVSTGGSGSRRRRT